MGLSMLSSSWHSLFELVTHLLDDRIVFSSYNFKIPKEDEGLQGEVFQQPQGLKSFLTKQTHWRLLLICLSLAWLLMYFYICFKIP